jgi:predicted RND superfamily exporter protein
VLVVTVAVNGVVWLLGLMQLLGYELDPYSILVPFLIFAIGLSHGAQKMNGIIRTSDVAPINTWRRATPSGACSWPG